MAALVGRRAVDGIAPASGVVKGLLPRVTVACVATGLGMASLTSCNGGSSDAPAELQGRAERIEASIVDAWRVRLGADGRLVDPRLGRRADYGGAMLLDGILRDAVRRRDVRSATRALRGLRDQARDPTLGAFELLAMSDAYRWAHRTLLSDPAMAGAWRASEPMIADFLATRTTLSDNPSVRSCFANAKCLGNQKLVGAAATVSLLGTGVQPPTSSALVGDPARRYADVEAVLALVARRVGTDVRRRGPAAITGAGLLSDPPSNPTAYAALSVALLGHVIKELRDDGRTIDAAVQAAFERAGAGLLAVVAPDGDASWLGRGQGQVWAAALAVAAGAQLAAQANDATLAAQGLALAQAALRRLERDYLAADGRVSLLPGRVPEPPVPAGRTTDRYAALRTYNGLTVWALRDAARALGEARGQGRPLPSAVPGVAVAPSSGGVLTMGRERLWLGAATRSYRARDGRYGPGLIALRAETGDRWRSVIPERPKTTESLPTMWLEGGGAPLLLDAGARPAEPSQAIVSGRWVGGGVAAKVTQRWLLTDRGVRIRWRMTVNRTVAVRALLASASRAPIPGGVVDSRGVRWVLRLDGRPADVSRRRRQLPAGSAYAPPATEVVLRAAARAGQLVELSVEDPAL